MIISIVVTAVAIAIGVTSIFFFGNDNPIEEVCEEIIEEITGVDDIDLSPEDKKSEEDINVAI